MSLGTYGERMRKCSSFLNKEEFNALLQTEPANMFYINGDDDRI